MLEARLYVLQRLTAVIMAPMVIGHLATILYATRAELTAESILARVQSSPWLVVFYTAFVVMVAIHAPLGLRKILIEWGRIRMRTANAISLVLFLAFLGMGLRGVWALTGGAA
jgi:fumarate reductase subunit C